MGKAVITRSASDAAIPQTVHCFFCHINRLFPSYNSGRMNLSELAGICDLSRTTAYKLIGLSEDRQASDNCTLLVECRNFINPKSHK